MKQFFLTGYFGLSFGLSQNLYKNRNNCFLCEASMHYIILHHTINPTAFVMTIWVSSSYFHIRIGQNIKLVQKKDCFYIGLSLLTSTICFQKTFYCFFTLFVTPMEYTQSYQRGLYYTVWYELSRNFYLRSIAYF